MTAAKMKGLSTSPGGSDRPNISTAHNSGKSPVVNYFGGNNKPMHPVSKVKSKSAPTKRK